MKLFYKEFPGHGKPLVIIHGLFGSSKNWISNAKELSKVSHVYCIDTRNHGDSPHSDSHSVRDLILDLKEFILDLDLKKPIVLGHSMGGLNALSFALEFPELIETLIVVDIAPRSYAIGYEAEFGALSMEVQNFDSRQAIDEEMKKILPDQFIRQFLQMNLEKLEIGYKWKLNVNTLKNSRDALSLELKDNIFYPNKSLFILGEDSEYINSNDKSLIKKYFPKAKIETIAKAGHYLHYTHSKPFLQIVSDFILGL